MSMTHHKFCLLFSTNRDQQDTYYAGTVIFRGYPFPKMDPLRAEHLLVLQTGFGKSGHKRGFVHNGGNEMFGNRQTGRPNSSMGEVSSPIRHQYWDERHMDTSLFPIVRCILTHLFEVTSQTQDMSGQVILGIMRKAKRDLENKVIKSKDLCPYLILTQAIDQSICGLHGYKIPYHSVLHLDSTDHLVDDYCECMWLYIEK